ncbi:WXG100-like domain-containing protein [Amycolatopsis thailandensis]|uniref:WXG100-like domain-containing protein n=1 Tax=Amycolatopsis thailandensis TaxID=589330 RepID=UPI00363B67C0
MSGTESTTRLPPELQRFFMVFLGMKWPEASESGLKAISRSWAEYHDELANVRAELGPVTAAVDRAMDGFTATEFVGFLRGDLTAGLDAMIEQSQAFAKQAKTAAADVQKAKIMLIAMAVMTMIAIVEALCSLIGAIFVPAIRAAATMTMRAILRLLVSKLSAVTFRQVAGAAWKFSLTAGKWAAGGAAFMGVLDGGIQFVQVELTGARDEYDTASLKGSIIGGAIGGAAAGMFHGLASGLGRTLAKDIRKHLPRVWQKGFDIGGAISYPIGQVAMVPVSAPFINWAAHDNARPWEGMLGALSGTSGKQGTNSGSGNGPSAGAPGLLEKVDRLTIPPVTQEPGGSAKSVKAGFETVEVPYPGKSPLGTLFTRTEPAAPEKTTSTLTAHDFLSGFSQSREPSEFLPESPSNIRPLQLPGLSTDRYADPAKVAEILTGLEKLAQEAETSGRRPDHRMLGPDLFGLGRTPEAPEALRGVDYDQLNAAQAMNLLRQVNLLHPLPTADAFTHEALASGAGQEVFITDWPDEDRSYWQERGIAADQLPVQRETPKLVHGIWLGGPLADSGLTGELQKRFAKSAETVGAQAVLWTDVSRDKIESALADENDPSLAGVRQMADWARRNGISLVNVDEVFNAEAPMRLDPFYRAELTKGVARGFAAASDTLRVEIVRRFGGVYVDGDDRLTDADAIRSLHDSKEGWALGVTTRDGGQAVNNSPLGMAKNHPVASFYLGQIEKKYELPQVELFPPGAATVPPTGFTTPGGSIRRNSVMFRTGPMIFENLFKELGITRPPALAGVDRSSFMSWVPGSKVEVQHSHLDSDDVADTTRLTAQVTQTLIRQLRNRQGNLQLTEVVDLVRQHANPDIPLTAALKFLATIPALRGEVNSVTSSRFIKDSFFHVPLTADVADLLGAREGDPTEFLGELIVPAKIKTPTAALDENKEADWRDSISREVMPELTREVNKLREAGAKRAAETSADAEPPAKRPRLPQEPHVTSSGLATTLTGSSVPFPSEQAARRDDILAARSESTELRIDLDAIDSQRLSAKARDLAESGIMRADQNFPAPVLTILHAPGDSTSATAAAKLLADAITPHVRQLRGDETTTAAEVGLVPELEEATSVRSGTAELRVDWDLRGPGRQSLEGTGPERFVSPLHITTELLPNRHPVLDDPSWAHSTDATADWMTDPAPPSREDLDAARPATGSVTVFGEDVGPTVLQLTPGSRTVPWRHPISYDHHRYEARPGSWVQEYTLRLAFAMPPHLDERTLVANAQAALDRYYNHRYRLPSGDALHIRVLHDSTGAAHDTVTIGPVASNNDMLHWAEDIDEHTLAHELGHFVGLQDEYVHRDADGTPWSLRGPSSNRVHDDDGLFTMHLERYLDDLRAESGSSRWSPSVKPRNLWRLESRARALGATIGVSSTRPSVTAQPTRLPESPAQAIEEVPPATLDAWPPETEGHEPDTGFVPAQDVSPDDINWLLPKNSRGQERMLTTTFGGALEDLLRRDIGYSTDITDRLIHLAQIDPEGNENISEVVSEWAGGPNPLRIFLDITAEGAYLTPLKDGRHTMLTPEQMADRVAASQEFRRMISAPVKPPLQLFTFVRTTPESAIPLNERFLLRLKELTGPWQTSYYTGAPNLAEHGLPLLSQRLTPGKALRTADVRYNSSDSIFSFVSSPDHTFSAPSAVDGHPVVVVMNAVDISARVELSDGKFTDLRGDRLGELLLTEPRFHRRLVDDPGQRVVLVVEGADGPVDQAKLGFDFAGALRKAGLFNDVLLGDVDGPSVSMLRAEDLRTEVITGIAGKPIGLFLRSPDDGALLTQVRAWAAQAPDPLDSYFGPGGNPMDGPWREPPVFLFVRRSESGFHTLRTDGKVLDLDAELLGRTVRDSTVLRDALGTGVVQADRRGPVIPVMVASIGGPVTELDRFAGSFSDAGYSREFFGPGGELTFGADGRLTLDGTGFERVAPAIPQRVAGYERANANLGGRGQYFPSLDFDRTSMSAHGVYESAVQSRIYYSITEQADYEAGTPEVTEAFLYPVSPDPQRSWTTTFHGTVGEGFWFAMPTGEPHQLGDRVKLTPEASAAVIFASAAFRAAIADGEVDFRLLSCWAGTNPSQGGESSAYLLGQALSQAGAPLRTITAADEAVVTVGDGTQKVERNGHFRQIVASGVPLAEPIPLRDLAASTIAAAYLSDGGDSDVRRSARQVARSAAWRARNTADLPEVSITGNGTISEDGFDQARRIAQIFLGEYRSERRRMAALGLKSPSVHLRLQASAGGWYAYDGVVEVVLPPHELGSVALDSRDPTAIAQAFAALDPDHLPGSEPRMPGHPSSADDPPALHLGMPSTNPVQQGREAPGLLPDDSDPDGEGDSDPDFPPPDGMVQAREQATQLADQIAQLARHLAALPPDFAPELRARVPSWTAQADWLRRAEALSTESIESLPGKVAEAERLVARTRQVRLVQIENSYDAAALPVEDGENPLTFHPDGVPGGVTSRPDARFGFEVEFQLRGEGYRGALDSLVPRLNAEGYIDGDGGWTLHEEPSDVGGVELVSPIRHGVPATWRELSGLLGSVRAHRTPTGEPPDGETMGGHVNFSFERPPELAVYGRLAQLNKAFEDVVYRLGNHYGLTPQHRELDAVGPNPIPLHPERITTVDQVQGLSARKFDAINFRHVLGGPGDRVEFRFWASSLDPAVWQAHAELSGAMMLAAHDPSLHRWLDELMVEPRLLGQDRSHRSREDALDALLDFLELLPLSPAAQDLAVGLFAWTTPWDLDANDPYLRFQCLAAPGGKVWFYPTAGMPADEAVRAVKSVAAERYPDAKVVIATLSPEGNKVEMWREEPVTLATFAAVLSARHGQWSVDVRPGEQPGRYVLAIHGGAAELGPTAADDIYIPIVATDGRVLVGEDGRIRTDTEWIELYRDPHRNPPVHTGLTDLADALAWLNENTADYDPYSPESAASPMDTGEPAERRGVLLSGPSAAPATISPRDADLSGATYVPVGTANPEDAVWTTTVNAQGRESAIYSYLDEQEGRQLRQEDGLAHEDLERIVWVQKSAATDNAPLTPWSNGSHRVEVFLEHHAGRQFIVQLTHGRFTLISPEKLAEWIVGSPEFQRMTAGAVRLPLSVVTLAGTAGDRRHEPTEAFLSRLTELTGPWPSCYQAGNSSRTGIGVLTVDSPFFPGPRLEPADLRYSSSGRVFSLLATGPTQVPPHGRETLFVELTGTPGSARVELSNGKLADFGGAQLGEVLLRDLAFLRQVKENPSLRVVLDTDLTDVEMTYGGLGFDFAGALREEKLFNDVYLRTADGTETLVSVPRAGDLRTEMIHDSQGAAIGLFVRFDDDAAALARVQEWASQVAGPLNAYLRADGRWEDSPWDARPIFLFAHRATAGYQALRSDGTPLDISAGRLGQSLRDDRRLRGMLGTGVDRSGNPATAVPIAIASIGGPATGLRQIADSFVPAGYSRQFYGPDGGVEVDPHGTLRLRGAAFTRIDPIQPGPQHLVSYERANAKLGGRGHFFPASESDIVSMAAHGIHEDAVQNKIYYSIDVVPDGEGGEYEIATPYLAPVRADPDHSWTTMVHGAEEGGFRFAMKTGRPDELGDRVLLTPEASAAVIFGADAFRRAFPQGDADVRLLACWADARTGTDEASSAQRVKATPQGVSLRSLTAAEFESLASEEGRYEVFDGGHFRRIREPKVPADEPIPLGDLAASSIETVFFTDATTNAPKVRKAARQAARASAWRARNLADLPKIAITGAGPTDAIGHEHARRIEQIFAEEFSSERARLAELGLPVPDLEVRTGWMDNETNADGAVYVLLPEHELGQSALASRDPVAIAEAFVALDPGYRLGDPVRRYHAPRALGRGVTLGFPNGSQAVEVVRDLDMTGSSRRAGAEREQLVHLVWLRGALGSTGVMERVREDLTRTAVTIGDRARVLLWTDVTRAQIARALRPVLSVRRDVDGQHEYDLDRIADMHDWARRTGVALVNLEDAIEAVDLAGDVHPAQPDENLALSFSASQAEVSPSFDESVATSWVLSRLGGVHLPPGHRVVGPLSSADPARSPQRSEPK